MAKANKDRIIIVAVTKRRTGPGGEVGKASKAQPRDNGRKAASGSVSARRGEE
jgi:hypothetical protein